MIETFHCMIKQCSMLTVIFIFHIQLHWTSYTCWFICDFYASLTKVSIIPSFFVSQKIQWMSTKMREKHFLSRDVSDTIELFSVAEALGYFFYKWSTSQQKRTMSFMCLQKTHSPMLYKSVTKYLLNFVFSEFESNLLHCLLFECTFQLRIVLAWQTLPIWLAHSIWAPMQWTYPLECCRMCVWQWQRWQFDGVGRLICVNIKWRALCAWVSKCSYRIKKTVCTQNSYISTKKRNQHRMLDF